jgi:rubredoxin
VTFEREVARVRIDTGPAGRAKLAREANVPHTEGANKLARQVLDAAEKKFYNLTVSNVSGFEATYSMQLARKPLGTLKATWNQGEAGLAVELQQVLGKGTKEEVESVKQYAELHGYTAMGPVLPGLMAASPGPGAYAVKSGNEYVVDFVEQAPKGGFDAVVAVAYIQEDFAEWRDIVTVKKGTIIERSYHEESRDGRLLITSFTTTRTDPGSDPMSSSYVLTYVEKDGVPFIGGFDVEEKMGGSYEARWTAALKSVTLKKEALAVGEAEGDEWGPAPSPDELIKLAEQAKVPRTNEAKKLAEKVISSVQKGYYSFVDLAAIGFEARLNVSFLGRPLGIASLKWGAVSDLSVEIVEQKDTRAAAQNLLKLIPADMGREIVRIFARPPAMDYYADCYAVQEGDQFTVDATELASKFDPDIKTKLLFVSADLRQLRTALIEKSGRMTLRVDDREKIEDKELVTSSAAWVITPGGDPVSLEYKWTYGQQAGATFVKTIRHRRDISGRKVTFAATLDNVKLERLDSPEQPTVTEPHAVAGLPTVEEARKLAQETKVPRAEEASQLASQVLASVQKKYHSVFHSTSVSGFQVTASVKKDDYDVGNIKITWKRDDPENVDPKPEKKVEDPVAIAIHGMAMELAAIDALMPLVLGPLRSAQAPQGYALKSGGLYVIDLTEATKSDNLKARILCVPQDFSRVQEMRSYKDGDVLEWILSGEAADGTFLISSATQPMSGPLGGDYQPTKFTWTYTRKGGGIFIKKVLVDQPLMGNVMHWTIEFGDVTFQGGEAAEGIPEDIQAAREQAMKNLEEQTRKALEEAMAGLDKWKCVVCGYIYDPKKGDAESNVDPGTPFEDMEDDWTCPDCGGAKDGFEQAD